MPPRLKKTAGGAPGSPRGARAVLMLSYAHPKQAAPPKQRRRLAPPTIIQRSSPYRRLARNEALQRVGPGGRPPPGHVVEPPNVVRHRRTSTPSRPLRSEHSVCGPPRPQPENLGRFPPAHLHKEGDVRGGGEFASSRCNSSVLWPALTSRVQ